MKLNRNNGKGNKYGLLLKRKLLSLEGTARDDADLAISNLKSLGVLLTGDEAADEQFFVLLYKDRFVPIALRAYAEAVQKHALGTSSLAAATRIDLAEYAGEVWKESVIAANSISHIPD